MFGRSRGRQRIRWCDEVKVDMECKCVVKEDALDSNNWRRRIKATDCDSYRTRILSGWRCGDLDRAGGRAPIVNTAFVRGSGDGAPIGNMGV